MLPPALVPAEPASRVAGSEVVNHGAVFERKFEYRSGPKRQIKNPANATQTKIGAPIYLKLRGMSPCALPNIKSAGK